VFVRVFTPRAVRKNQKIQYKIAREKYRDIKGAKRAQKRDENRARWEAMSPRQKQITVIVFALIVLLFIVLGSVGCGSSGITVPPQPPTVTQVAAMIHASGGSSCGPAIGVGVVDDGVAYVPGEKIGIDIFANSTVRNNWEKMSANFGVVPLEQGPDWVAYRALSQTKGCN
jgi:hypothetical protein